jgi:hypothetical protein
MPGVSFAADILPLFDKTSADRKLIAILHKDSERINHIVELTGDDTAHGTSLVESFYGVEEESFIVAGRYTEDYVRSNGQWLFKSMRLALISLSTERAMGWP